MKDERRSAVEAFGCPFRFDAIYNKGVDDTGDEAIRGRAFHAAAHVYTLRLVAKGLRQDAEEALLAFPEGVAITGLPDHLISEVSDLFFNWAERFELDVEAFLQGEEWLVRQVTSSRRREWRADLVYARPSGLEVVDRKTFYRGLTKAQALRELQPRWYLVEAKRVYPGFVRYSFTYDFVRFGQTLTLHFTPEEVDAMEAGVQAAIDAVTRAEELGEYPPMPGSHCTLCRLACPIVDDDRRMPIRVTTKKEAIDAAGQILVLEQRIKAARKAVKGWCERNGPLEVRGEVFAFRSEDAITVPADTAIEILEASYPRPERLMVSMAELKRADPMKIARHNRRLAEEAVTKQRWPFRHQKAGELTTGGDDDGQQTHRLSDDT